MQLQKIKPKPLNFRRAQIWWLFINAKNWSQADAAIQLGLTQPRVSDLVNGRIDKFSIDKLMTCLYRIGFRFKPSFSDDQLTMAVETVKEH